MSQIIKKSPINVLDEFCKRKLQPPSEYIFSSDNNNDFLCSVTAFTETKTATAKSKKKAKQLAAQNLIRHLRSLESFKFDLVFLTDSINSDDAEVSSSTTKELKRKTNAKSDSDINHIGKLLEYCIKNKLPPASFELVEYSDHTQSHLREFHMKCRVNDIERQGKGFCKKQAKKQAAMEVLNVLTHGKPQPKSDSKLDEPPLKRLKATVEFTSQKQNNAVTVPSRIPIKVENEGNDLVNKSAANKDKEVCVISDDEDNVDDWDGDDRSDEDDSELPSEQEFENESPYDSDGNDF